MQLLAAATTDIMKTMNVFVSFYSNFFQPCITKPTQMVAGQGPSIYDIFTS